ncbi:hypothetical protein ACQP1S_30135 [Micromonospora matsumotoense]|uniref:hypothetical protein n=1 Tax=Micromonospora matsumotoense TaxID=121616 RepID=UPI003D901235
MPDDSRESHGSQPQERAPTLEDKPDHRIAYIGLAVTVLPFFIAAMRMYVVANGNLSVIKSLGSTLNIQSLLLGTYLGILPAFFLFGATFLVFHVSFTEYPNITGRWQRLAMAACLAMFGAMLLDTDQAVAVVLYVAATAVSLVLADAAGRILLGRVIAKAVLSGARVPFFGLSESVAAEMGFTPSKEMLRRGRIARRILRGGRYFIYGGLALLLLVQVLFPPGMWLPTESIGIRSQKTAIIGYVLDEKDDRVTILRRDGLGVERFHVDDVVNRQICDDRLEKEPVFVKLFGRSVRTDKIPVCKELQ